MIVAITKLSSQAFIGRLNVKAVQTSTTGQISRPTIHTVSGSQGRSWKEVKINYKPKDNIAVSVKSSLLIYTYFSAISYHY